MNRFLVILLAASFALTALATVSDNAAGSGDARRAGVSERGSAAEAAGLGGDGAVRAERGFGV